ncbi:putative Beta-galactosidase 17 [Nannochloris sp. 'desiccata']|nr:hypothetical protein KSW81_005982 [Chlorella desiccata (nom. nud.)]KAH7621224.1 putative Beta-galactosidase 17 [Chlorella desiccata (nom. nud.)]
MRGRPIAADKASHASFRHTQSPNPHLKLIHMSLQKSLPFAAPLLGLLLVYGVSAAVAAGGAPNTSSSSSPSFYLENDRFMLDGSPFQIISGAIHYFRIHPGLWLDRLTRLKALGVNTIEIYIPWNWHEPYPGQYDFSGGADLDRFITMVEQLDLKVLLRAGPYICAEWDFGGLPAWLASSAISGGGSGNGTGDYTKMKLRSADQNYLHHVDRWWRVLLPRIAPRLRNNGGPVLMVQIENEFGLCNNGNDPVYLRHLAALAKELLGEDQVLFTTDPAHAAAGGSLPGDEVFTAVDFGPQWFEIEDYFSTQKSLNAPGKGPYLDSEFYTGWLSHWGEAMANTSSVLLAQDTDVILRYGNNTGSFNFYMAHGGTNFGFWQGANAEIDGRYEPHITSYDYDSPISEAGQTCQPGIGVGDGCKFILLREVIEKYTGIKAPEVPPEPNILGYGDVELVAVGQLMNAAGPPIVSNLPLHMEEYGQQRGIIVYRTELEISQYVDILTFPEKVATTEKEDKNSSVYFSSSSSPTLNFVVPPSDYASVLINGELQGRLVRGGSANLTLPALGKEKRKHFLGGGEGGKSNSSPSLTLDVIVEAMGRRNFGCDPPLGAWDTKGLQSTDIRLDEICC